MSVSVSVSVFWREICSRGAESRLKKKKKTRLENFRQKVFLRGIRKSESSRQTRTLAHAPVPSRSNPDADSPNDVARHGLVGRSREVTSSKGDVVATAAGIVAAPAAVADAEGIIGQRRRQ